KSDGRSAGALGWSLPRRETHRNGWNPTKVVETGHFLPTSLVHASPHGQGRIEAPSRLPAIGLRMYSQPAVGLQGAPDSSSPRTTKISCRAGCTEIVFRKAMTPARLTWSPGSAELSQLGGFSSACPFRYSFRAG